MTTSPSRATAAWIRWAPTAGPRTAAATGSGPKAARIPIRSRRVAPPAGPAATGAGRPKSARRAATRARRREGKAPRVGEGWPRQGERGPAGIVARKSCQGSPRAARQALAMPVPLDLGRHGDAVGQLIELALEEDVGPGDRTAEACVPADARGTALIVAKEPLVVSGVSAAARVFRALDGECQLEALLGEGGPADAGAGVLRVRGRLRALLS